MRPLLKALLPVALLAAALAGAGWLRATRPTVEPAPPAERVYKVSVTEAAFADRRPTLTLYGEVVAAREVTLRPLVAGEVVRVARQLVEGGRFAAGEEVLAIDPFDYEMALAEAEAAGREARARRGEAAAALDAERRLLDLTREQLELAEGELARRERLVGRGAVTQSAVDDARMAASRERSALAVREQVIATLEARLAQQEAALARAGVVRRRAERDLANVELRAPFAGAVAEVMASLGKRLSVGDSVARLIDDAGLEVRFTLGDAEFGRLWADGLIGRGIAARWRLRGAAFDLAAEVERVQAAIDATAGGIEVFAPITGNPGGAPLRPGAFVEVLVPDRLYRNVAELPQSALFDGDTVYAVRHGRLVARAVEVLARTGAGGMVLVRGDDLIEGEPVVTSRLAEIGPGLKVEIVREVRPGAPGPEVGRRDGSAGAVAADGNRTALR